jgi:hypothetical protein
MTIDKEIIIAVIAIAFITIGLIHLEKGNRLKKKGKKAKAIIFANNYKILRPGKRGIYYPVVRFVTEDNEWITQELSFGQNPAIPEGKEVEVFYDPTKPQEVVINSNLQLVYAPWLFIVLGACGFIVSALELLDVTNLI